MIFSMNSHKSETFRKSLMNVSDDHLHDLRLWYDKKGDKGEQELMLIDLEIERRAKIRRYYENYIY